MMFSRIAAIAPNILSNVLTGVLPAIQRWLRRLVLLGMVVLMAIAISGSGRLPTASARVMQEELRTGAILYKSLRTLTDNRGYSWQAIAFRQIPEAPPARRQSQDASLAQAYAGAEPMYLRLVGFPGAVTIDRSRPLIVAAPAGQQFTLGDRSDLIFKNDLPPQPNVAQYPLADVLDELRSPLPLRLTLPTVDAAAPVELRLPRAVVGEWLEVNQQALQAQR